MVRNDEELLPLKYGVFATNFILWASDSNPKSMLLSWPFEFFPQSLGVGVLGIAIWIRSDSALWVYTDNMSIGRYYAACYICLVVGAIILLIGFAGCIAAARESTTLMFVVSR